MSPKAAKNTEDNVPQDARWFTINSAHIVREEPLEVLTALCGQKTIDPSAVVTDKPDGKTCETCLSIYAGIQDDAKEEA